VQLLEKVVGIVDNRMRGGGHEDHGVEAPDSYRWLEDDVLLDDAATDDDEVEIS
jgi:hypothetical protein